MNSLIDDEIRYATFVRSAPETVYDGIATSDGLDGWFPQARMWTLAPEGGSPSTGWISDLIKSLVKTGVRSLKRIGLAASSSSGSPTTRPTSPRWRSISNLLKAAPSSGCASTATRTHPTDCALC
jgi:hypothetical protein